MLSGNCSKDNNPPPTLMKEVGDVSISFSPLFFSLTSNYQCKTFFSVKYFNNLLKEKQIKLNLISKDCHLVFIKKSIKKYLKTMYGCFIFIF